MCVRQFFYLSLLIKFLVAHTTLLVPKILEINRQKIIQCQGRFNSHEVRLNMEKLQKLTKLEF